MFLLPGRGERAGGQHSAEATARQRSGSGSDPERRQTHRHPGTGARLGDHQPAMELTQQAGTSCSEVCLCSCSCVTLSHFFFFTDIDLYVHRLTLSSGGRADRPAAGGPVALWEIPGCSGASAKLAERHGGAGGQSEASVCRVPRRQGPDPRTKGRRRKEGQKIKSSFTSKNANNEKSFRNVIKAELRDVFL